MLTCVKLCVSMQALASAMETDLANGVLGPREAAQKLVQRFVDNISSNSSNAAPS